MSQPTIYYREGVTCLFWDVEDYPFPDEFILDPVSLYEKIERKLWEHGKLSIRVYFADKSIFSEELVKKYKDAGFEMDFFPGETKMSKIWSMLVDVLLWSFKNPPPSNLFLLSKNVAVDESSISILEGLYGRDYGVLLSDPEPDWDLASGTSQWLWTSLFYDD